MANLDNRSKRASSVGILLPFLLAVPAPDGTIAQADRQHAAHTYSGIAALSTTPPDDADVSVSTITDALGYRIRPAHFIISHAFDSARNAHIGNPDRPSLDRYRVLSVRTGRTAAYGDLLRLVLEHGRAGERASIRGVRLQIAPHGGDSRLRTYTTAATDALGYGIRYPSFEASFSMDSLKNADLAQVNASDRDRTRVRLTIPMAGRSGDVARLYLETDGRAGGRISIASIRVNVNATGRDAQVRARAT